MTLHCASGEICSPIIATDSVGFFAFENLAPGSYDLGISGVIVPLVQNRYRVKAGMETSYSLGLHLTPTEEKYTAKMTINGKTETVFICD